MNKILNISLGITLVAMVGMFFLPNLLSANAQNATTTLDVESVKSIIDRAKEAMDSGDNMGALQLLEQAEDQLNTVEDSLQTSLGIDD